MAIEADHCDVAIVGTGAGGGIIAHRLAKAGLKVVSLEQGGRLPDDYFSETAPPGAKLDFGIGPSTVWPADPHDSLFVHPLFADGAHGATPRPADGFRHFQILKLNGLQNLWNGVSVRFCEADFAGWPFGYDHLADDYSQVERLITVCGTKEGIAELPDGEFIPPKPLRPADTMIVNAVKSLREPFSHAIPNRKAIITTPGLANSCISTGICTSGCPVGAVYKFSARLLPEIAGLDNYELRTNAKVTRVLREPGAETVSGVEYIDTKTGERRRLEARFVVLAAGAIETPRILFNSADDADPAGLANRTDRVGQGLQDNPKSVLSTSLLKLWGHKRTYDIGYGDLLILMSRGKLPDGSDFPFIGHAIHGLPDVPHYLSGFAGFPPAVKIRMARMMFHSYVTLGLFCAGEARPENRIRPGSTTDSDGVPQVTIDFTTPPAAREQMASMLKWGRKILRKASATKIYESIDNNGTGIHYAGTTAISDDPSAGVVDRDLRCHGLDNLYVCDGGVIPNLPDKHLTLSIMALSNRLGRHLEERVQSETKVAA
ncbi:GMC oxidoreductase [Amorphus coralli]|uniref:GMC oxidoreductase n=1 Tax=Amorphus coralli TaxID=340680 RepID=UPI000362E99B|nr:GMC family oxidoreductase [Amorphus coralli]